MKKRSLILSFFLIISVAAITKVSYVYLTKVKTEYQTAQQKKQTQQSESSQVESQQNLTPKQNEIGKYKSQLMFLQADENRIVAVNQNISYNMGLLLSSKTSGMVKIDVSKAKEFQTDINNYWKQNDHFTTPQGVEVSKEYASYMNNVNTYLSEGIKTGEVDAGNMPQFPASNMAPLKTQINSITDQLIGLGASLNFSSNTPFDVQNSTADAGQSA